MARKLPASSLRSVRAHEFIFLLTLRPHYFYDAEAVREPAVSKPYQTSAHPPPALSGGKYARIQDPQVRAAAKYARRDAPWSPDRNLRSWWTIPSSPFAGAHTATFPPRLVEPCILAGTSAAGCCSRCGRPWERVVEVSYESLSQPRRERRHADPDVFEIAQRQMRRARTAGWRPTCECGAPTVPAVVLDPFAGTGTTVAVARRLGRAGVAIELQRNFLELITARLSDEGPAAAEKAA